MKIEVSAKTIEKAIEEGLKQLNTTLENVDVKVISEGGLFKKAKIEMEFNDGTSESSISENSASQTQELNNNVETKIVEQNENENNENFENLEEINSETKTNENAVVIETEVTEEQIEPKKVLEEIVKVSENIVDTLSDEEKQARKQELINKTMELAKQWLDGLIYTYNINATCEIEPRENDVYANIVGENLGVLIGYHGEAMESIQHLLNTYLYNKLKGAKRVFIDVAGYRSKRQADLKELANKIANKVLENKRSYKLDPMNSFERRIIHEELSKTPHILTHSEGVEPNRFLIIEYTEN
mgnify:CR=1 FL=1